MSDAPPTVRLSAGVVAAGLAAWAALSDPFTASADAVTAIAIGLMAVAVAWRWGVPAAVGPDTQRPTPGRWWPWAALAVAVLAWELLSFFLGPRVDHPTVSSFYDAATRARPVKGLAFLGWLALGAALIRLRTVER